MSKSPYLPEDLKQYLRQHKIEDTLSNVFNDLLRQKVDDPYAFMMDSFGKLASDDIKILNVKAYDVMNSDHLPSIKCVFTVTYKFKQYEINLPNVFHVASEHSAVLYDNEEDHFQGKGMNKAISKINCEVNDLLKTRIVSQQQDLDKLLEKLFSETGLGLNFTIPISFSLPLIAGSIFQKQPFEQYREIFKYKLDEDNSMNRPKIMVNLLQGSKLAGVKCKVYKFLLFINDYESADEAYQIVYQITQNIRKTIISGKQGEAALKLFPADGTYICTVDTIADNFKMIEEAINKTNFKEKIGLGLSMMADNLYNPDTKKYELENLKQLMDVDQMIDNYVKLTTERPMIQYLEDPIYSQDTDGWLKIMAKFKDTKVKIGSRHLYSDLKTAISLSQEVENPDLPQEELDALNAKKLNLDMSFVKPYDFPTLSKLQEFSDYMIQKKTPTCLILGDNITESADTSYIDLAFAIKNSFLNMGAPDKYPKQLKYMRFAEILKLQQKQN